MKEMVWSDNNVVFTVNELTTEVTSIYTNIVTNGEQNRVDPKDAKIIALTSKVQNLEGKSNYDQSENRNRNKNKRNTSLIYIILNLQMYLLASIVKHFSSRNIIRTL